MALQDAHLLHSCNFKLTNDKKVTIDNTIIMETMSANKKCHEIGYLKSCSSNTNLTNYDV